MLQSAPIPARQYLLSILRFEERELVSIFMDVVKHEILAVFPDSVTVCTHADWGKKVKKVSLLIQLIESNNTYKTLQYSGSNRIRVLIFSLFRKDKKNSLVSGLEGEGSPGRAAVERKHLVVKIHRFSYSKVVKTNKQIKYLTSNMLMLNTFAKSGIIWMWFCIKKFPMSCSVAEMEIFGGVSIYSTGLAALLWWIFSILSSLEWSGLLAVKRGLTGTYPFSVRKQICHVFILDLCFASRG